MNKDISVSELNTQSIVNIVNSDGNKYVFNNEKMYTSTKKYILSDGTYILKNVPKLHPIAILNKDKTKFITYSGDEDKKITDSSIVEGKGYVFYYGDVKIKVLGDFGTISVLCGNHGYMGGKDIFKYISQPILHDCKKCKKKRQIHTLKNIIYLVLFIAIIILLSCLYIKYFKK